MRGRTAAVRLAVSCRQLLSARGGGSMRQSAFDSACLPLAQHARAERLEGRPPTTRVTAYPTAACATLIAAANGSHRPALLICPFPLHMMQRWAQLEESYRHVAGVPLGVKPAFKALQVGHGGLPPLVWDWVGCTDWRCHVRGATCVEHVCGNGVAVRPSLGACPASLQALFSSHSSNCPPLARRSRAQWAAG